MNQTKLTAVIRPRNQEAALKSEGFLLMEDFWITGDDKHVKNQRTGKIHKVLEFKRIRLKRRASNIANGPVVEEAFSCIRTSDQHQIQIGDKLEVIHDQAKAYNT